VHNRFHWKPCCASRRTPFDTVKRIPANVPRYDANPDETLPMTVPTLAPAGGAPAALTAFLRGVERRGAVFTELLCGDPVRGDAALVVAMRAFGNAAAQAPVAGWPRQFWSLLLAVPSLRAAAPAPHWPLPLAVLAPLGTGPRAALLLRLVVGLRETEAAAVLGIAAPTYRLALQRALPHLRDGSPDTASWQALAEALQRALWQLPVERLANVRDAMARSPQRAASPSPTRREVASLRPWTRPALWAALATSALAFVATFVAPGVLRVEDLPQIQATPLPPAEAPATTFDADTALLTHRDFEQLADAREDALIRDLDFYAWYATQIALQPSGAPLLLPDAGAPLPAPGDNHAPR
jgi:hypothetical protein